MNLRLVYKIVLSKVFLNIEYIWIFIYNILHHVTEHLLIEYLIYNTITANSLNVSYLLSFSSTFIWLKRFNIKIKWEIATVWI